MSATLKCIDPATLSAWLAAGTAIVVDVREPHEHAREHIAGCWLMPLSKLDANTLPRDAQVVLCCASGCRSKTAARRLGLEGLAHLQGGLAAWIDAGLPTVRTPTQIPSAMHFGATAQLA